MSPKELLYIDDALGHEKQLDDCCSKFAAELQDADLKNFVQELCTKHKSNFNMFYGLLGN